MTQAEARAEFRFHKAAIRGIVTTVGEQCVRFVDEGPKLGLSEAEIARLQRAIGLDRRHIVENGQTTVDLCEASARRLLIGCDVAASSVQALILVTQSPDYSAPSSAIALAKSSRGCSD